MTDRYKIDSHKLMYHVPKVNDWLDKKTIYPIYMEVSPAGACNHRCTFCALDFMEYQKRYLDASVFKERLIEMGQLGVKSIMYAGEGEPFLHKLYSITKDLKDDRSIKVSPRNFYDIAPMIEMMRLRKSAAEIETIEVALDITKKAHEVAMREAKSARFEYELQAVIEHQFKKEGAMVKRRTLAKLTPYLFLIVPLVIYLVWVIGPMFYTFYLSFTDWDGLSEPSFIGWRNYQKLYKDPVFYTSLKNNLKWILSFITIPVAAGLALAMALNRSIPGERRGRTGWSQRLGLTPAAGNRDEAPFRNPGCKRRLTLSA